MREPVVDRIDFIHRTFQEYLAAKRLIAAHDVGVLLSHAHEPSWREVVILATGHALDGCELILKGLLERADKESKHRHYLSLLTVSCLETATAFSDRNSKGNPELDWPSLCHPKTSLRQKSSHLPVR